MKLGRNLTFFLFLIFGGLSIYFFKERILFVDSAAQIFKIVNLEKINVEAHRYTSALPDFLPVLLVKLNVGLRWVTIAYSFAFVLSFFILFLISEFFLKARYAGILILLVVSLSAGHTFFHASTETHLALVYCVLFYSWLFSPRFTMHNVHTAIYLLVSALLITLCYFAHPVTFFVILFILGLSFIYHKLTKDYRIYVLLAFTLALYSFKTFTTNTDDYEGDLFSNLVSFREILGHLGSVYTFQWFMGRLTNIYLPALIVLIALNIWYFVKRKWLLAGLLNSFSLGFVLISILVYYQGDADHMLEKSFMPLNFIVFLPLILEMQKMDKRVQQVLFIALCFLVMNNFLIINHTSIKFTARHKKIVALVHQLEEKGKCKGLISNDDVAYLGIGPDWAMACETIFISSFDGPSKTKTIYADSKNDSTLTQGNDYFIYLPWYGKWNPKELNDKYFRLCDEEYIRLQVQDNH